MRCASKARAKRSLALFLALGPTWSGNQFDEGRKHGPSSLYEGAHVVVISYLLKNI